MLKRLAKRILKKELEVLNETLKNSLRSEKRLSEIINELNQEEIEDREMRKYCFAPKSLTAEEQEIIGDFVETPIIELLSKWFKLKADQNNDILQHGNLDQIQDAKLKVAVLMYDDRKMFIENCQKIYEKSNPKEKKKK